MQIDNPMVNVAGESATRRRTISLLFFCLVLINTAMVSTAIYLCQVDEWHYPLLRFIFRCGKNFLGLESSSGNGFISTLLLAVPEGLAIVFCLRFIRGPAAVKEERYVENAAIGLLVVMILVVLVYGPQLAYEVTKTVYQEHELMKARNVALRNNDSQLSNLLRDRDKTINDLHAPVRQNITTIAYACPDDPTHCAQMLVITNKIEKSFSFTVKCYEPIASVRVTPFDQRKRTIVEADGEAKSLGPLTWKTETIRAPYWKPDFPYTIAVIYKDSWKVPSSCDLQVSSD